MKIIVTLLLTLSVLVQCNLKGTCLPESRIYRFAYEYMNEISIDTNKYTASFYPDGVNRQEQIVHLRMSAKGSPANSDSINARLNTVKGCPSGFGPPIMCIADLNRINICSEPALNENDNLEQLTLVCYAATPETYNITRETLSLFNSKDKGHIVSNNIELTFPSPDTSGNYSFTISFYGNSGKVISSTTPPIYLKGKNEQP